MSSPAEYNDNLASLAALPALLEKWGYPDAALAPKDLYEIASHIIATPGLRAGDYVVQLGFATQAHVCLLYTSRVHIMFRSAVAEIRTRLPPISSGRRPL